MSLAGFDVKMFSTNSRAWLVIGEFGIEKGSKTLIMCKGNAESLQFVPKKTEIIYDSTQYYIVDLNIIRQNNQTDVSQSVPLASTDPQKYKSRNTLPAGQKRI